MTEYQTRIIERLQANLDIWQKTAEDALDEVERLRRVIEAKQAGEELVRTEKAFVAQAEKEARLEIERLRVRVAYLEGALEACPVERLRAELAKHEGGVCYGDFVGECYRVGRVPCSECEEWNRRP